MSLIGQYLRQHSVEFIPGVGMVFDGTRTDATSLNGPWTWQTPDGVLAGELDGCSGGGGGGGGGTSTTAAGGGGGGGGSMCVVAIPVSWAAGAILTVTVGAGGTGGAAGATGTNGGTTTVTGLLTNQYLSVPTNAAGEISFLRGGAGSGAASTGGGGGSTSGGSNSMAPGGAGGSSGAAAGNGSGGNEYVQSYFGTVYAQGGCGGGGSSTTATVAGGVGLSWMQGGGKFLNTWAAYFGGYVGGENGTISWGGGGGGGPSLFGLPGGPAAGLAGAGSNATGYGAGGGGGNGNGVGGNGSPGYVKITYWSAD